MNYRYLKALSGIIAMPFISNKKLLGQKQQAPSTQFYSEYARCQILIEVFKFLG